MKVKSREIESDNCCSNSRLSSFSLSHFSPIVHFSVICSTLFAMSDEEEQVQTSYSPAVKVGGMRVARHVRETEEKPLPRSELMKQAAEHNSEITSVRVTDLLTKEELDFHDKTVKSMHDKPQPSISKPHTDPTRRIIQQPMK
ncbi:hypothetical protein X801_01066 [Opisthorchis viverrini]|uniref:Uncharacterized protein n=1 Tax=Opisthorchis viverrini TaxID=6198 RepID=A0A1S8X8L6_OPIVI|nr:hypothetical protein X801_01066 [Opisthorchis viverrini]